MALSYLILGSNSGDKENLLRHAITLLDQKLGQIIATSSVYETAAWGYTSENSYLNQALSIETPHSPLEVLHITQLIEKRLGRSSKSVNEIYTDRPIDIDILFYDNKVVNHPKLTIPHPHLCERRFVLVPINELAPELCHPIRQKTMRQLLSSCDDKLAVRKL
ncbi:MAG: 2-amino-4-hydroxy-6-hydroxymethyldihydropteridine diphosphokinase [Bacteroidales bacterium]|nr:2-amino-4-hydroxy-6-hydroxymethyldihydropteridine diphosphokinase [Bacteroidales bacterium]